jgi:transcriptional regulator with XRE-family HTH domain
MRPWGITITDLAMTMGVSRQYIWQVLYGKIPVSEEKWNEVTAAIEARICERRSGASFGQRLRGARLGAGLTLRQIAAQIGYSWVAVERWEKDICLPKPGVLWHLRHLYGVGDDWFPLDGQTASARSRATQQVFG